jgi:hypothetical protein
MKLIILIFITFMATAATACPAPSVAEFQKHQEYLAYDIYGMHAEFDFTGEAECLSEDSDFTQRTIEDGGGAGYYENHVLYLIVHQGKVIFASTSEYFDLTYGSIHGTPDAECRWNERFEFLKGSGF